MIEYLKLFPDYFIWFLIIVFSCFGFVAFLFAIGTFVEKQKTWGIIETGLGMLFAALLSAFATVGLYYFVIYI